MSKIVCDVCGTSYPETATQCPICGCVRPSDVNVVTGDTSVAEGEKSGTYTYVKGGRFSKANVRKRHQGQTPNVEQRVEPAEVRPKKPAGGQNIGLVIAISILLLAIIGAVIYITLHFFAGAPAPLPAETTLDTSASTIETTEENTMVACTEILVSKTSVTLNNAGDTCQLSVSVEPADTTDAVAYASSDDLVATVSEDGLITAVGNGEAIIAITCGEATAQCQVVCAISEEQTEETTEPAETTAPTETTAPIEASEGARISHKDVTLNMNGFEHQKTFELLLTGANGNAVEVEWVIANPEICEISDNKVTPLKVGKTKISTTYEGETYECIVRVYRG